MNLYEKVLLWVAICNLVAFIINKLFIKDDDLSSATLVISFLLCVAMFVGWSNGVWGINL